MGNFSNKLGKRKPAQRNANAALQDVEQATSALLRRPDGRLALRLVDAVAEHLDATAREAPEAPRWACAAGCNFCCHMPVIATPAELVRLANAIVAHPDASQLRAKILANADAVERMDEEQLFASRLPCALLDADGRCSAYTARPLACRAHVSFSREQCEAAHDDPDRSDREFDGDPVMQQARTDADTRLATTLIASRLDGMGYELHDGLARALELDPRRWSEPEAFVGCRTLSDREAFDAELRAAIAEA
jgi:Fe-S-cluster containining protein